MTAEETVEKFNERFPVGAIVRWRSVASDKMPRREYTVQYAAINHYGNPVAWFAEKSGMVSVAADFVDYENDGRN